MKRGRLALPEPFSGSVFADSGDEIESAILFLSGGIWFPVFGSLPDEPAREAIRSFVLARGYSAFSCIGLESDVEALVSTLFMKPVETVRYLDMALDAPEREFPPQSLVGLSSRPAGPCDFEKLRPLQAAYELEEVILDPESFDSKASAAALRRSLADEIVVVAELDGAIVAKAQTNARGIVRDQVGGVYVLPGLRGRGIGRFVVATLLAAIAADGRGASLFVKKGNLPAVSLYAGLGFDFVGNFRIDYFA